MASTVVLDGRPKFKGSFHLSPMMQNDFSMFFMSSVASSPCIFAFKPMYLFGLIWLHVFYFILSTKDLGNLVKMFDLFCF